MAQWTIRSGRGWVMMKGRRVRPSLDRDAQLHFRVDAAAHLVGPGLGEGDLEFGSGLLKTAIEGQAFAGHGDVVGRAVIVDEDHYLSLGHTQVRNAELQSFLGNRERRGGAYCAGEQHGRDQTKQTCSIHHYLRKRYGVHCGNWGTTAGESTLVSVSRKASR